MPVMEKDYSVDDERPRRRKLNRNTRTDHVAGEEASSEAFSHYLHLANGDTVKFNVGATPNEPMPVSFGGVPVVGVDHAIASGTESEENEE